MSSLIASALVTSANGGARVVIEVVDNENVTVERLSYAHTSPAGPDVAAQIERTLARAHYQVVGEWYASGDRLNAPVIRMSEE